MNADITHSHYPVCDYSWHASIPHCPYNNTTSLSHYITSWSYEWWNVFIGQRESWENVPVIYKSTWSQMISSYRSKLPEEANWALFRSLFGLYFSPEKQEQNWPHVTWRSFSKERLFNLTVCTEQRPVWQTECRFMEEKTESHPDHKSSCSCCVFMEWYSKGTPLVQNYLLDVYII